MEKIPLRIEKVTERFYSPHRYAAEKGKRFVDVVVGYKYCIGDKEWELIKKEEKMVIYSVMNLIGSIMSKEEYEKLAKAVLLAQDIHEISWNTIKEDYTKTQKDAAEEAVAKVYHGQYLGSHVTFIEDMNHYYWNGIQYWAQAILGIKGGENG